MTEMGSHHFLADPPMTPDVERLFEEDLEDGFVMNVTRLWAYEPATIDGLFDLLGTAAKAGDLSFRQRGVLVASTASTMGDPYCSLAWGIKLAEAANEQTAAGVLSGDDTNLDSRDKAMAGWARKVARDPIGTTEADVEELRSAGLSDREIFAITVFVALRIAFATVNNALGADPDRELAETAPKPVLDAINFRQ